MRNLGKASLSGTVAFLLIGGGLAACEVSTTVIPLDGSVLPDASNDGTTNTDAPITTDGGTDAPTTDGGGLTVQEFKAAVDKTSCERFTICCKSEPLFDPAACPTTIGGGLESMIGGLTVPGVNLTNISVDQTKATKCLNELQLMTCPNAPGVPSTEYKQLLADCYSALKGTVAVNGTCHHDIECTLGNYCDGAYTPGAGAPRAGTFNTAGGKCKPLVALGASCVATDTGAGDNCSNRGSGDTGRFCNQNDASKKCEALLPAGAPCNITSLSCSSSACETDTVTCGTKYVDSLVCTYFVKP